MLTISKHGNITEPPAQEAPTPKQFLRFASPPPFAERPPSPSAESVFCPTCVKNQTIVHEILSSYLPDEDSPDYERYLNSYSAHQEELEQRYPPVCASCAPRAREKIKRAGYVAKTDHLRRMMDLTRQGRIREISWSAWKRLLIQLVGWTWWLTIMIQVLWHASSVLSIIDLRKQGQELDLAVSSDLLSIPLTLRSCAKAIVTTHEFAVPCCLALQPVIPMALRTAIPTIIWNKQLLSRNFQAGGKLLHLWQHFGIQAALLGFRYGTFHLLKDHVSRWTKQELLAAHAMSAILIMIVRLISPLSVLQLTLAVFSRFVARSRGRYDATNLFPCPRRRYLAQCPSQPTSSVAEITSFCTCSGSRSVSCVCEQDDDISNSQNGNAYSTCFPTRITSHAAITITNASS